jgi:membrane protease YdiL (CAAX protease family)
MNSASFIAYYSNHMYKINALVQLVCIGGVLIWNAFKRYNSLAFYSKFKNRRIPTYIFYGIGLWIVSSSMNMLLSIFFPKYSTEVQALFTNKEVLFRFFVIVIFAPVLEEFIFRGQIQNLLKIGFKVKTAIVLQGFLFGIIHPMSLQKVYAVLLGIGLGMIKEKEKNLQSSTIVHMTINLIGFVIGTLTLT